MTHRFDITELTPLGIARAAGRVVWPRSSARRYRVALIDKRIDRTHLMAGLPVVITTEDPEAASASLLRNRDPRAWSIRVQSG